MKKSIAFILIIFACLLAAFSTGSVQPAAAQAPSPQDSRWIEFPEMARAAHAVQGALLAVPPPDPGALPEPPPVQPDSAQPNFMAWGNLGRFSKLVYQQWFGDNYEIVVADGDGNNPVRLTLNLANDMRPNLNKDASRIYFASDRDGNFEIYSMNLIGGDVRRLTNHSGTDTRPVVSPDGAKIAFVSEKAGRAQIFLMNPDGSGIAQLTGAPPSFGAYDCAWSPDGSQIAFSAMNNQGLGYVHVINLANGAVYRTHWNQLFMIYDLSWQPGGSNLVAFDAIDPNGTYALSNIYTVEINGSQYNYPSRRTYTSPSDPYQEQWVSTWLHDPKYLLAEYVHYTRDGDYLYLDNVYFRILDAQSTQTSDFVPVLSLSNPPFAMDADWVPTETIPPVSRLNSLPQYTRAGFLELRWFSDTTGGIPIAFYDLYSNTTYLDTDFLRLTTIPGSQSNYFIYVSTDMPVMFGLTATDEFGFSESNPPAGDRVVTTRVYQYEFSGQMMDHHGAPLPNVPLVTQPISINNPSSSADGHFNGYLDYLPSGDFLYLTPSAPGYGSLPETEFDFAHNGDIQYVMFLPPAGNMVQNGNFEYNDLAGWGVSGTLVVNTSSSILHSGKQAALIGGCGSDCLKPSGEHLPIPLIGYYDFKLTQEGNGMILGEKDDNLLFFQQTDDGSWLLPEFIASSANPKITYTALLPSENGSLTACWRQDPDRYCAQKSAGGVWQTPILMPPHSVYTTYLVDRLGRLFIHDKYRMCYLQDDGTWSENEPFPGTPDSPQISFDINNNPILVDITDFYTITSTRIAGVWQPLQILKLTSGNEWIDYWGTNNQGWSVLASHSQFRLRKPDGTWMPVIIPAQYGKPRVGPNGELYNLTPNSIRSFDKLTGWNVYDDQIYNGEGVFDIDQNGEFHSIQTYFDTELWSSVFEVLSYPRATESGDGGLSQTVTIPAGAHRPTLSFLYRLLGMQDSPGSSFEVTLTQGADTTTLFTTDQGASDWTHQPIDLSLWAGQTVALNFTLHQAAGGTVPELNLDEVSLGEWLTPLVTSAEPASIGLISPPQTITIHGENFIATPTVWIDSIQVPAGQVAYIDDSTLTITLISPSLAPGHHTIKVINPGWYAGALANAFQSGVPLYMPLISR